MVSQGSSLGLCAYRAWNFLYRASVILQIRVSSA